ncbi:MAG: type II toxin-antitoxin system PemK/MazF family toxin [Lachnospiraceae bacterium]|nr:type II toxin-antitoxin system PemK/MazF family toxin [Lachnospiraceae bacterium]
MKDIITGGVYAVDLHGTESYEFKGVHPALVVRMLKEEKMYYIVPLTTYTKERWEKCKRKGFGTRIISTNSIARVDKMNIVSEKQVQGRYYNAGHLVIPTEEEIKAVLKRVEEYILLTDDKSNREYSKFVIQRSKFEKDMDMIIDKNYEEFPYTITFESDMSIFYPCSELSFISNADIKDIIRIKFNTLAVVICKQGINMKISIKFEEENLLTFSESYDKFKLQKGSVIHETSCVL